jgi:hypothetical protein
VYEPHSNAHLRLVYELFAPGNSQNEVMAPVLRRGHHFHGATGGQGTVPDERWTQRRAAMGPSWPDDTPC